MKVGGKISISGEGGVGWPAGKVGIGSNVLVLDLYVQIGLDEI